MGIHIETTIKTILFIMTLFPLQKKSIESPSTCTVGTSDPHVEYAGCVISQKNWNLYHLINISKH